MFLFSIFNSILCAANTEQQQTSSFSLRDYVDNFRTRMEPTFQRFTPVFQRAKKVYIQLRNKYNELTDRLYDKLMYGPRPLQLNNDQSMQDYKYVLNQLKEALNKIKDEKNKEELTKEKNNNEEENKEESIMEKEKETIGKGEDL